MKKLIFKTVALLLALAMLGLSGTKQASATQAMPVVIGGYYHSLALKPDGTVWAWGKNDCGQLGDGTTINKSIPVQVQNLFGVVAIAAGDYHSLAVKSDGTVWAWGKNDCGQLGDDTTINRSTPVQVKGPDGSGYLTGVVAVAVGSNYSLALKSDGTVWAWGSNISGQLGDGTFSSGRYTPVQVQNLSDVVAIAAKGGHSLALKSDGTVWAWGVNGNGELGNGTTQGSTVPLKVLNLDGVVSIAAGYQHSLALKSDGTIWAWGRNGEGQLGNGTYDSYKSVPVQVSYISNGVMIAAGYSDSLALGSDGIAWGWGSNYFGEIGNAAKYQRIPYQISGFYRAVTIEAGHLHSFAVKSDGTVWALGYNNCGQLGDGTATNRSTPIQVQNLNISAPVVSVESVIVSPNSLNLLVGQTKQLTVTAQMSDGSTQDVTAQASYTSSNSSIASVSQDGLVTANSAGVATITVSYQGKTATVSVLSALPVAVVDYLTIEPNPVILLKGDSQPLTVTAYYSDGSTKDVTASASYQVSDPSVAGVSGCRVTALNVGSAVLTASYEGKSASATVSITSAVESISVEPSSVTLQAGGSQQLTVTAHYSDGTTADVTGQASYQTNDQSVASVSSDGMVAGIAPGSATVTVSYEGKTASVPVTVAGTENPPSGPPNTGPVVVSPPPRPGAPVIGSRPDSNPALITPPQRPGAPTIGTRPVSNPVVAPVERPTGTPSLAVTQPSRQTGSIAVVSPLARSQGSGYTVISKTR